MYSYKSANCVKSTGILIRKVRDLKIYELFHTEWRYAIKLIYNGNFLVAEEIL